MSEQVMISRELLKRLCERKSAESIDDEYIARAELRKILDAPSKPVSAQPAGEVPRVLGWLHPEGFSHVTFMRVVLNAWKDAGIQPIELIDKAQHTRIVAALQARAVVMPDNLLSHRVTWRQALVRLIELETEADPETGRDDKAYWQHELRAFDAMYADLDRLNGKDGV